MNINSWIKNTAVFLLKTETNFLAFMVLDFALKRSV